MRVGALIDDEGALLRGGADVFFRRDIGGRYRLDLRRISLDHVGARARVMGVYVGNDLIDVDEIRAL